MNKDLQIAKKTVKTEIQALKKLSASFTNSSQFSKAVSLCSKTKNKIVVVGVGKSFIISLKVASTLSSLGSPAVGFSANDLQHGGLGFLSKDDTLLIFSVSGESSELNAILRYANRFNLKVIGVSCKSSSMLLKHSNIKVSISNYDFLKNKVDNNFSSKIPIKDYLHIHLDEKWISNIYIRKYTDINPNFFDFMQFLDEINKKNDILITTGLIDFNLIEDLKNKYFEKLSDKIFFKKNGNKSIYLVYKPLFEDLESLLRNSKTLIACHGSIIHAANSFNVKKIDILEKSKISFYSRFTSHLSDYHTVYRSDFNSVKSEIYKKVF